MFALVVVVVMAAAGRDDDFVRAYDAVAPGLGARFKAANDALESEQLEEAGARFSALVDAAPKLSVGVRRLAFVRSQQGRHDEAIALAERAQALELSPSNDLALAEALVARGRTGDEGRAVQLVNRTLDAHAEGSEFWMAAKLTECFRLWRAKEASGFRACARTLLAAAPTNPSVRAFAAQVAMIDGDFELARARLEEARPGLSVARYERLSKLLDEREPVASRYGRKLVWATTAWLTVLVVMAALGGLLSALTMRSARRLATERQAHVDSGARALRATYRAVMGLGAVYFYVSLPFIALAVLAVFGGLVSVAFAGAVMPIKLLGVALTGGPSLIALVRSLFVRARDEEPGLRLDLATQPRFKSTIDAVASRVCTRTVDTVFLTAGTELAVFERGSTLERLRGRGERCLIIGRGVLDGMLLGGFRAVLAHEFGHFCHEDTAGGDVALMARRSLMRMGTALAESGVAGWHNPAWWFFRGYLWVFLRISQGASRLQEVLADRVAIFTFGSAAFAQGYRHVVAQSVRFTRHADSSVRQCVEHEQPMLNLFRFVPTNQPAEHDLEQAVEAHFGREPEAFDSHPSAKDRLAWAANLAVQVLPESSDRELVLSLFDDLEALEREVTNLLRLSLFMNHGVVLAPFGTR